MREPAVISSLDQPAILRIRDDLRNAADPRCKHGRTAGHGLNQARAKWLIARIQHEKIRRLQYAGYVAKLAGEMNAISQSPKP